MGGEAKCKNKTLKIIYYGNHSFKLTNYKPKQDNLSNSIEKQKNIKSLKDITIHVLQSKARMIPSTFQESNVSGQ